MFHNPFTPSIVISGSGRFFFVFQPQPNDVTLNDPGMAIRLNGLRCSFLWSSDGRGCSTIVAQDETLGDRANTGEKGTYLNGGGGGYLP